MRLKFASCTSRRAPHSNRVRCKAGKHPSSNQTIQDYGKPTSILLYSCGWAGLEPFGKLAETGGFGDFRSSKPAVRPHSRFEPSDSGAAIPAVSSSTLRSRKPGRIPGPIPSRIPRERSGTDSDRRLRAGRGSAPQRRVAGLPPRMYAVLHWSFPINQLDALRLRRGLADLEVRAPERAEGVRRRARESVARLSGDFPGDP